MMKQDTSRYVYGKLLFLSVLKKAAVGVSTPGQPAHSSTQLLEKMVAVSSVDIEAGDDELMMRF